MHYQAGAWEREKNLEKVRQGCEKIGGCTNEQYDEFLKKILNGE